MSETDKFIAMVSAKVDVDLRLGDFQPRSMLVAQAHSVPRAKFAAIDFHNHLDAQDPADVLRIMDECGIERTVNITMKVGEEALAILRRFMPSRPSASRPLPGWTGTACTIPVFSNWRLSVCSALLRLAPAG